MPLTRAFLERQRDAVAAVTESMGTTGPENTRRAYSRHIDKFKTWCTKNGSEDGFLVTEDKVILFIDEEMLAREDIRARAGSRSRVKNDSGQVIGKYGKSTIEQGVSALISLWDRQRAEGLSNVARIRGPRLAQKLRTIEYEEGARRQNGHVDRGAFTMTDSYSEIQKQQLVGHFFQEARASRQFISSLRARFIFLFCHTSLVRNDNIRMAKLTDFVGITFTNEGPTPCLAMVLKIWTSKTRRQGSSARPKYAAAMRHKVLEACPISAFAVYLFSRWHFGSEGLPDFSDHHKWYDIYACTGYNEQLRTGFNVVGIMSSHTTHSGRASGANAADLLGVSEDQIRRAGHWDGTAMMEAYVTGFPRKFMRALSGFEPDGRHDYFVPRAHVMPPEGLAQQIFPGIDTILKGILEGTIEQDLAARDFLLQLKSLRTVLLQDAAVLYRSVHQSHPLFLHPVFQSAEFRDFATMHQARLQEPDLVEMPHLQMLRRVVPQIPIVLETQLQALQLSMSQGLDKISQQVESRLQVSDAKVDNLSHSLTATYQGLHMLRDIHSTLSSAFKLPTSGLNGGFTPEVSPNTTSLQPVSIYQESASNLPPSAQNIRNSAIILPAADIAATESEVRQMPVVSMNRSVMSVPMLWMEYSVGINGLPSIRSMEDRFQSKWRASASDRKFWSKRKDIYKKVEAMITEGMTTEEAVNTLERFRKEKEFSLVALNDHIRAQ